MLKWFFVLVLFLMASINISCSHTPGDTALRSGHPEAAADLYMKGAELGDPEAALKLGLLLNDGSVSVERYGQPSRWFQRACELGNLPGCPNLGVAYEYGENGVPKDFMKARDYYLKASEKGYIQSQYNLSSLYSNGYIKPQNNVEGLKWMLLSQESAKLCSSSVCQWILKDPPAHKEKLRKRMTELQIKEAERLAASWKIKK